MPPLCSYILQGSSRSNSQKREFDLEELCRKGEDDKRMDLNAARFMLLRIVIGQNVNPILTVEPKRILGGGNSYTMIKKGGFLKV